MKNKIKTGLISFSLLLVTISCSGPKTEASVKKIGFVKNQKLYNDFTMAKEMETDYKNTISIRKKLIDSLELEIRGLTKQLQSMPEQDQDMLFQLEEKQRLYMSKSKEFQEANDIMAQNTFNDIWERINLYVEEYGKAHGYQYIFGAVGNGGLMYADEGEDLTEELIIYCNKKYSGE